MGFLSDMKIKRELKKLEGQLEDEPTADVFRRLAEIYAENEEDLHKAVTTAGEGLRAFPTDGGLTETHGKYNKILLKQEIIKIEKKILNFPSASMFVKLCEKYFQIGEYDKAESYASTSIREYPDKSAPYIVLGRIFRSRNNDAEALGMYEKACMLDRYNYDALMEYGELLEKNNDPSKALSIYKSVLFFAPADARATEKIKVLLKEVEDAPAPPRPETEQFTKGEDTPFNIDFGEEPTAAAPDATPDPVQAPPTDADSAPAEMDAGAPAPVEASAPVPDEGSVAGEMLEMLQDFRKIDGVEGSILIDNYGLSIAEDTQGMLDSDLLAAVLTNMLRTIKQHAGPADFGAFMDGFVESEKMNLHLYSIKDVELVIFSNSKTRLGLLEMKVKNFIDKFLEIEAEL